MADLEKQEGKDVSNFQYDDANAERHDRNREEAKRQALNMGSTVGSNGLTETLRGRENVICLKTRMKWGIWTVLSFKEI